MKTAEIKELSVADLKEKIEDMVEQQSKMKLAHAVSQLENPIQIKNNRKTIAKLKTELRKRELNEKAEA
ncbi:MAG: 50S ribosomal protein L29 [Crocinitomicaceae bacterium]|nr:50S ribosomal protein L29 [Crocinitomicaceae bacterium]